MSTARGPSHHRGRGPLWAALALLAPTGAAAQHKLLTLDDIYDPEKKVEFSGTAPTDLTWISDTHYLWPRQEHKAETTELIKVEALTGRAEPLFDVARVEGRLATLDGVTPEDAKRLARQRFYISNQSRTALVLEIGGDLFHYDLITHQDRRLTRGEGKEEEASISPDGKQVAFVRGHDLFVVDVAAPRERALTTDGSPDLLNGKLDWLYQEEIYGRGNFRAYWWSPDSARLAFLQLNEKKVPRYTLVDDIPYRPTVESYPYPKAGDPNPGVRLGVVASAGGSPVWMDLGRPDEDVLVVAVAWSGDGREVAYQLQDREQTWLELRLADPVNGRSRTLVRETTSAWVQPHGNPAWLKDGGFLWLSERTGFKHLYRYGREGRLIRAVTAGEWEVRALHGIEERGGWAYFSGTARSPLAPDVYRVRLDGTGLQRLSKRPGTHQARFNPSFTHYLDTWSDVSTPPQVRLHRADGSEARLVEGNPVAALEQYRLARPELLQVPARDGFLMEALLLKPPDFDPSRKYPVYQLTYGGPQDPIVRDAWGGTGYMFHQLLAQKGMVVWICDNRTASGKGARSAWPGYKRLGETELMDIEDGIAWLKRQGWVDADRIGIYGWSYGGFMVSYALTHSRTFAMGIAGGAVTDWRDYDTVYTERYMSTPQKNPEGYRKASPRLAAADLHGNLLLLHGALDDNVHPQNTLQFAHELQKAGRPFRLMLYPKARHGVTDPPLLKHLRATILDFIEETLLGGRLRDQQ